MSDGTREARYAYGHDGGTVTNIDIGGLVRVSRTLDGLDRLTDTTTRVGDEILHRSAYQLNDADQRIRQTLADGRYWAYAYDQLGQLVSAKQYSAAGVPVDDAQFTYAFDSIGNRINASSSAESVPSVVDYSSNELNQYLQIEQSGQAAPMYRGTIFLLDPSPSSAPPSSSVEQLTYDADGNLLSDGSWQYTWNGENRLIETESLPVVTDAAKVKVVNLYDYMGRRVRKTVSTDYSGGTYSITNVTHFVWDGYNIVAEMSGGTGSTPSVTNSYTWGLDLSGSPQGAGGVGGLLTIHEGRDGSPSRPFFPAFDGNGNVVNLVDASDGTTAATYEYDPFGNIISSSGPMAETNPFRFSTKPTDLQTDLIMYQLRPYSPTLGRFLTRDPIEERSDENLYLFVRNCALSSYDLVGLWHSDVHKDKTREWATLKVKIPDSGSELIANSDDNADSIWDPTALPFTDNNWSWHFDRSGGGKDSRLKHFSRKLNSAKFFCNWDAHGRDDWDLAGKHLGYGLHALQDWVAHGDFNRKKEAPYINSVGHDIVLALKYVHNGLAPSGSGGSGSAPDDVTLDANGPDGRASFLVLHFAMTTSVGDRLYWAYFHPGTKRIKLTERKTVAGLSEFQEYVRKHGKPCGECMKHYVGD